MGFRTLHTCISECTARIKTTRILDIKIEFNHEWDPGKVRSSINFLVKSLYMPSIDEIPIIESLLKSIYNKYRISIYEFESLSSSESRSSRLTKLINKSIEGGHGILLILPSLFPVALISRLDQKHMNILEDSFLLKATITYSNILYLPLSREIEIVAKKNSEASYERVEWLREKAKERGIKVSRVVLLEDNSTILRYVTRGGRNTIYRSVPVTKLAYLIALLSVCMRLDDIEVLEKDDTSQQLVYAYGIEYNDGYAIKEMLYRSNGMMIRDLDSGILSNYIDKGCEKGLGELGKLFYIE